MHLVPLRRRHLRSVLRIEAQVYPGRGRLPLFMSELNLRNSRHYVAARVDGTVVGYGGLMFSGDEAHVTTIAVDPAWHRHQIGTRLLLNLARAVAGPRRPPPDPRGPGDQHAAPRPCTAGSASRRPGVRKNYYAETNEDALVMWAHDIDSPAYADRLAAIEAGIAGHHRRRDATARRRTGP